MIKPQVMRKRPAGAEQTPGIITSRANQPLLGSLADDPSHSRNTDRKRYQSSDIFALKQITLE